jgi:hypothetical protein
MSCRYDTIINQGADWTRTLTWQTSDGAAVNLTGYTARMQLRAYGRDVVELTTENGRITLGGAAGTVTLNLPAAVTTTMAAVAYDYDLEVVVGISVTRLLEGTATVSPNTTR